MNYIQKTPNFLRRKNLIGIAAGIIAGICLIYPLLNLEGEKSEFSNSTYISLPTIQGNSLLSVSNPNNPLKSVQKIRVLVTAYSSTPDQTDNDPFITASGSFVKDGIVANNLLPFGTKIRIPEIYGDKVFTVEDRMHWKKGYYHLDIWFPSYWQAKSFGAKKAYIEVLEN